MGGDDSNAGEHSTSQMMLSKDDQGVFCGRPSAGQGPPEMWGCGGQGKGVEARVGPCKPPICISNVYVVLCSPEMMALQADGWKDLRGVSLPPIFGGDGEGAGRVVLT